LMQIHPAVNIWDRDGAERFVSDLRAVDPDVTGTPVITYEAIRLMERAYKQGTLYAIVVVSGLTFLMLRRVRETLLALLPLALGLIWTAGLMRVFDLKFNLGNVFGLPLILGAAAEYGLNLVMRFMEGREHGGPLVARSTVMGVLVAGLTTISGFGSLMLADHRGIYGLGLLLTLGTAASLIPSPLVRPALPRSRRPPPAPPPGPRPRPPGRARLRARKRVIVSGRPLVTPRGTRDAPRFCVLLGQPVRDTSMGLEWSAGPPPMSVTRSSVRKFTPWPSG